MNFGDHEAAPNGDTYMGGLGVVLLKRYRVYRFGDNPRWRTVCGEWILPGWQAVARQQKSSSAAISASKIPPALF
jgi:hypothetical protein